jgi:uncharacterized OB-fold protein
MPGTLSAPLKVEFDYTRSLGPVLSRFMTGLRDRSILGCRAADGRVLVPPTEFDPASHEAPTEFVEVGQTGTVTTWTWVSSPVADQPLEHPFAFALVLLDGADTPILHAVDAGSPDAMSTGMRVRVRWAEETRGHIRDFLFEPAGETDHAEVAADDGRSAEERQRAWPRRPQQDGSDAEVSGRRAAQATSDAAGGSGDRGDVTGIITPVRLAYTYAASQEESRFYRGLAEGKIRGQRCPKCQKVYVPPRGACPVDGVPTTDEVELPDRGIVTTYCIVNVPFLGQRITPPYVSAYVLLEGADIAFLHLIVGCDPSEVRMGMRVEAVWRPRDEWGTTIENIDHFRPTGEPDAPYESFANHL